MVAVLGDPAPNVNSDGVDAGAGAPKLENDGIEVAVLSLVAAGTPNEAAAPNAGVEVVLVEVTEGANGRGGLLAPNANGVLFDVVVVVVPADGKLKPDVDDKPLPNKGADVVVAVLPAVVVVAVKLKGAGVDENVVGNARPPVAVVVAVGIGNVDELVVAVLVEKLNKFGVTDAAAVVVGAAGAVDNDEDEDENDNVGGAVAVPNENRGGLSDEIVEADVVVDDVVVGVVPKLVPNAIGVAVVDVVVAIDVLPKPPNVTGAELVVAIALVPNPPNVIGADAVVVVIAGVIEVLVVVAVIADGNVPNDAGKVEPVVVPIGKRLVVVDVAVLSELADVTPNNGAFVIGNEDVVVVREVEVVASGFVIIFSFVVAGVNPNDGRVLVVESVEVVVMGNDGTENVFPVVVGTDIDDDVTTDTDSVEIVV